MLSELVYQIKRNELVHTAADMFYKYITMNLLFKIIREYDNLAQLVSVGRSIYTKTPKKLIYCVNLQNGPSG